MRSFRSLSFVSVILSSALVGHAAPTTGDWPAWRGPTRDGHAAAGQTVPLKWSETEKVVWRAPIRGKGHGSPTVVGDRIYLATADESAGEQLVVCLDRATGKPVWQTVVHRGKLETLGHRNNSNASSTVVSDAGRLFVNFFHAGAVHTTSLDTAGRIVWQQKINDFVMHQGFGSSPVIHESIVLVSSDHKGGGTLAGLDRQSGRIVWRQPRPEIANYASPAIFTIGGRTQAVLHGCNLITSVDPLTGRKLWEMEGSTEETVVTAASDGKRVFVSGGYPRNHVMAVEADGSKRVAWQNGARLYVPTMLVRDGHIFAVLDAGQAVCWKSDTGEERWREKVDRDFYSSPVMLGDRVFVTSMKGVTSVFEAAPDRFRLLAQNRLGDEAFATPAICGNRIYLRHAKKEGTNRQEYLWCIGE